MEYGWDESIQNVLKESNEAMHYKDIAEEIERRQLRSSLGATPANTVNTFINSSLKKEGVNSPYIKVSRGHYALRDSYSNPNLSHVGADEDSEKAGGLVQSLGMFWRQEKVNWRSNPKILGQQQSGSDTIDFGGQRGVYLLHDRAQVIYVGRSIDRPMGQRLFEHTKDRLSGRWDRFSWFGLCAVNENGSLDDMVVSDVTEDQLVSTLEAVLIESLEPPQNRRRGDQLSAVEYLQASDGDLKQKQIDAITALIGGTLAVGA